MPSVRAVAVCFAAAVTVGAIIGGVLFAQAKKEAAKDPKHCCFISCDRDDDAQPCEHAGKALGLAILGIIFLGASGCCVLCGGIFFCCSCRAQRNLPVLRPTAQPTASADYNVYAGTVATHCRAAQDTNETCPTAPPLTITVHMPPPSEGLYHAGETMPAGGAGSAYSALDGPQPEGRITMSSV